MKQAQFMYEFNDKTRHKFNDKFFHKSDDDIIEDLKDMILSCQRDKFYTIKVEKFEVIDDYAQVQEILTGQDTPTISIKDSDLRILKVYYYAKTFMQDPEKGEGRFEVIIAVPRVIDNAYIRLNGNNYFPVFQLVDSSTYNNTAAQSAKTQSITLKTNSNAIKMLRNFVEYTDSNEKIKRFTLFSLYVFDHKVGLFEYFFARFGWYGTLNMFGFTGILHISDKDPDSSEFYTFKIQAGAMKEPIYIYTYKYIFDEDKIIQSCIATVIKILNQYGNRKTTVEAIIDKEYWVSRLGGNFVKTESGMLNKGIAIIESLENSYDISTKKRLRLPDEMKEDIYSIIKWMACEFSFIRLKDNLDVSKKRIRWSEYIAALYIMILNQKLRRLPERHNEVLEVSRIKQVITTAPMALISELQKSSLKGFRNMVNDRDSFLQLKYTIKGPSGPGESNGKNIARAIRSVDPSHLGIIDMNTSSPSDPGVGGMLCPLNYGLYEWDSFNNEDEPTTWDAKFSELIDMYREKKGLISAIALADDAGVELNDRPNLESVAYDVACMENIIGKVARTKEFEYQLTPAIIPMEDSNTIIYEED